MKSLAVRAVDLAEWVREASSWEEWEEVKEKEQESQRSVQEERWLWRRLEESDREQAKAERYNNPKKAEKMLRQERR